MVNLTEILQSTLHTSVEVRQEAEIFVQKSLSNNDFVFSLLNFSRDQENVLHLRQLSLVLISQQARKRLSSFSPEERCVLCGASLEILDSPERLLKNCGVSLLASLFTHGSRDEQEHITSALFGALQSDDLESLRVACSCLCEIVNDANLSDQLIILTNCHSRLLEIFCHVDQDEVDFLRNISKIYRVVACRVSDCKMAEESTPEVDESIRPIFEQFMDIGCGWLTDCTDVEDLLSNCGILVEIVRFLCHVVDMYPDMCIRRRGNSTAAESPTYVQTVTQSSWSILNSLVHVHSEYNSAAGESDGEDKYREYMQRATGDGDRIGVDMLIIYLFELLRGCLDVYGNSTASSIDVETMGGLISVLMRYMQLTSRQLYQYFRDGNEYISSEEDESGELSVRHGGRDFMVGIYCSSPKTVFEAVVRNTESQLEHLPEGSMSESDAVWLEALLFTLSSIGKRFVKRVLTSRSKTPADSAQGVDEGNIKRINTIIRRLIKLYYVNYLSALKGNQSSFQGDMALSLVRGAISRVLKCYAFILPHRVPIRPILNTAIQLVAGTTDEGVQCEEGVAARLQHCQAVATLLQAGAREFGSEAVLDEENTVDRVVSSCLLLCQEASDCTIHIPLETITMYISTATTALSSIISGDDVDLENLSLPTYIQPETISKVVVAGLAIWSNYCYDPFVMEVSKDMLGSLVKYCSYSDALIELFSQEFIPPIESVLSTASAKDVSTKIFCDVAVKLLVDSSSPDINKHTTCSSILALPALGAINAMLEFAISASKEKDCSIDVGDTLYTFCSLMSTGHITRHQDSISQELATSIASNIMECVRAIFETGVDYTYSAALGSFCHIISAFSECVDFSLVKNNIHCIINVAGNTSRSNNRRNIIVMGLVHLFLRNPILVAQALNSMEISEHETALHFLLDEWFSLHPLLESDYNLHISTSGMMEVIKLYVAQGVSEGFLLRTLRTLLDTLPTVLRNEEMGEKEDSDIDEKSFLGGLDDDDDDDDFAYDYSDDGEGEEDFDGLCDADATSTVGAVGDGSPFAPAEMYLSDLIDVNCSGGLVSGQSPSRPVHVYIPNDMVFVPHKSDPVFQNSIMASLQNMFREAQNGQAGLLLNCLNALDPHEMQLVQHVINSSGDSSS